MRRTPWWRRGLLRRSRPNRACRWARGSLEWACPLLVRRGEEPSHWGLTVPKGPPCGAVRSSEPPAAGAPSAARAAEAAPTGAAATAAEAAPAEPTTQATAPGAAVAAATQQDPAQHEAAQVDAA